MKDRRENEEKGIADGSPTKESSYSLALIAIQSV